MWHNTCPINNPVCIYLLPLLDCECSRDKDKLSCCSVPSWRPAQCDHLLLVVSVSLLSMLSSPLSTWQTKWAFKTWPLYPFVPSSFSGKRIPYPFKVALEPHRGWSLPTSNHQFHSCLLLPSSAPAHYFLFQSTHTPPISPPPSPSSGYLLLISSLLQGSLSWYIQVRCPWC